MLEHIGDVLGASFCQDDVKNAQNRSKLLEIARILSLASARTQICVLTVCQQQHWQVLEHCANSRIRVGVGPKSVLTVDVGVLTLERRPWYSCPRPISYFTHHTQRISLGICKEEARAIHGETSKSKADLTRLAGAVGALM